ncbi:hypothetical protein GP475_07770 [Corynebacterium poyangense]|uniref:Low molecular weight antigen MTB12-like C-terminal domain-containing protein n=1 Tax=Corynebacterium poyangense TaxID=2684405 RepID=A0A7H0SPS2_9CORY|nr:hypothetical protein [Corynebacterium poyangense]MBZ8178134.1 hypothetical protein [Corynebacterium poyangense]QNQ90547.1 hypothetical protein GP475_07770 [Corynebacterium poyangense]
MKLTRIAAATAVLATAVTLTACSQDKGSEESSTSAASSSSSAAAMPELPSAADLNAVIAAATDPNLPVEEKAKTVQEGETATDLFSVLAARKAELGSNFEVQDPVLPGYTNDSVLATLIYTEGERHEEIQGITFVHEDGHWKLSKADACILITSALPPEQVPAMCKDSLPPADGQPAPGGQPAPDGQPAPAPAPGSEAPAPEQPAAH